MDLNNLYYFAKIVEHNGFTAAARVLGVPKSKLSRRIALLEDELGIRLIQRSSRRFAITDVGQEFCDHCTAMIHQAEAAQAIIANMRSGPRGVIRVACPPWLLAHHLGSAISRFLSDNGNVDIRVKLFNRRVDLIREGFDIALAEGAVVEYSSTVATRKVGEISCCLVASPKLLAGRAHPSQPDDISALPTIDMWDFGSQEQHAEGRWVLTDPSGHATSVRHKARVITDDLSLMRDAAVEGIGVAWLPHTFVERDLDSGRLVRLLPEHRVPSTQIYAYIPSKKGMPPSVRVFLDFLVAEYTFYRQGSSDGSSR